MTNAKAVNKAKLKRPDNKKDKSLARKIEGIDRKMQAALEKGDFVVAKQLAEEQERLLEHLMLDQQSR